jgi:hypothetical protein
MGFVWHASASFLPVAISFLASADLIRRFELLFIPLLLILLSAGSVEQRTRLLGMIRSLIPVAARAEALRKHTSEALSAYGSIVDAATDLTLRIEAKLLEEQKKEPK